MALKDDAMDLTISTTNSECERLAARFREFSEACWKRETYCPDWCASQIVGHLTLGAQFYASTVGNGLEGNHGFPLGASTREEFMEIRTSRMNEVAALDGNALVDKFESDTKELIALYRTLEPGDFDKSAWHRRGVIPIRYFVIQRIYEFLLHEWDIRNEPEASLHPDALEVAAGNLHIRFPIMYNTRPDPKPDSRFRFETTDTGHVWAISVVNGKASGLTDLSGNFDVSLFASASDFLLMSTGRADAEAKKNSGAFRIEGDAAKVSALLPAIFYPI
ncbi:MAG: maleylpyruvate isomerase family mycothiol-dependent enzyme [Nitrospinota bacterium]